jgi:SIR2-like domain
VRTGGCAARQPPKPTATRCLTRKVTASNLRESMDTQELKRRLQDHLTDGLVLIVGSGASAQLGIPTMAELAEHILTHPPATTNDEAERQWGIVSDALRTGRDLETAMSEVELDPMLEEHIVRLTAELIGSKERAIIQNAISGAVKLPLTGLFHHITATVTSLPVVTPNYDRLIEVAADLAGIGVDSMFVGEIVSRFDSVNSREALGYAAHTRMRNEIKRSYRKHVRVLKPHGSLDWFNHDGAPVRCGAALDLPRLMIAPGKTKYVKGYEKPFDVHRAAANEAIDKAARFLVIGFGFNDQQLETHLRPQIKSGRPCLIITKSLSSNASAIVQYSNSVIALSEPLTDGPPGTVVSTSSGESFFPGTSLWDLETFLSEVLA